MSCAEAGTIPIQASAANARLKRRSAAGRRELRVISSLSTERIGPSSRMPVPNIPTSGKANRNDCHSAEHAADSGHDRTSQRPRSLGTTGPGGQRQGCPDGRVAAPSIQSTTARMPLACPQAMPTASSSCVSAAACRLLLHCRAPMRCRPAGRAASRSGSDQRAACLDRAVSAALSFRPPGHRPVGIVQRPADLRAERCARKRAECRSHQLAPAGADSGSPGARRQPRREPCRRSPSVHWPDTLQAPGRRRISEE